MRETPKVIISGFADEGPEDKKAEAQLTMLATLGMSHYSLRFVDVGQGVKNVMQLTQPETARLRQLHGEFGIAVASIGSPIGKVKLLDVEDGSSNTYIPFDQYLQQDVQRAVDLASEFETRLIRGFSFYHPQGEDPAGYVEPAAERLAQIAEVCSRGETIFGLEVEANLVGQNGRLLQKLFEMVDHPNLCLIFDGGNLSSQNFTPVETLAEYHAMREGFGWLHI